MSKTRKQLAQECIGRGGVHEIGDGAVVLNHVLGTIWKVQRADGTLVRVRFTPFGGNEVPRIAEIIDQPAGRSARPADPNPVVKDGDMVQVGSDWFITGRREGSDAVYRQLRDGSWTVVN